MNNLMIATLGTGSRLEVTSPTARGLDLRSEQDFYPQRFSADGSVKAPVTYAGFGIHAPKLNYDDYGDRVKGRIALILEHEPGERDPDSPFDGVVTAEAAVAIKKVLRGTGRGRGRCAVRDRRAQSPRAAELRSLGAHVLAAPGAAHRPLHAGQLGRPGAHTRRQISPALAEVLIRGTGRSLADLSKAAETPRGYAGLALTGVEVTLTTAVDRHVVADRNCWHLSRARDPKLKDEVVIVSAHYDHEGADGAVIFNGADDDGSGTVALLEIADAYAMAAAAGQRPRRSVLFACWGRKNADRCWARGAHRAATFPLASTVAVLNMDMVGRNEEVQVGGGPRFNGLEVQTAESNRNALNILGYSRHPELSAIVERVNQGAYGLELKMRYDNNSSNLLRRSDQWPFLQNGVPALWFHRPAPGITTPRNRPARASIKLRRRWRRSPGWFPPGELHAGDAGRQAEVTADGRRQKTKAEGRRQKAKHGSRCPVSGVRRILEP